MSRITRRDASLKQVLTERRQALQNEVEIGLRDERAARNNDVRDTLDDSDADMQGDMTLALLQMRSQAVGRIDAALARLDAGDYGTCVDCARAITERRLQALPFAVRCQKCEERREQAQDSEQRAVSRRGSVPLFSDGLRP